MTLQYGTTSLRHKFKQMSNLETSIDLIVDWDLYELAGFGECID